VIFRAASEVSIASFLLSSVASGRARLTDVLDEAADVLHRGRHALREPTHLGRHEREAAPRLARVARLERAVQGEEIAAIGDLADDLEDLADAARVRVELTDARDHPLRGLHRALGVLEHALDRLGDVRRRLGERLHRLADLAHRARLRGRGHLLLLGRGEDLRRGGAELERGLAHLLDDGAQALRHVAERLGEVADARHAHVEPARRDLARHLRERAEEPEQVIEVDPEPADVVVRDHRNGAELREATVLDELPRRRGARWAR